MLEKYKTIGVELRRFCLRRQCGSNTILQELQQFLPRRSLNRGPGNTKISHHHRRELREQLLRLKRSTPSHNGSTSQQKALLLDALHSREREKPNRSGANRTPTGHTPVDPQRQLETEPEVDARGTAEIESCLK